MISIAIIHSPSDDVLSLEMEESLTVAGGNVSRYTTNSDYMDFVKRAESWSVLILLTTPSSVKDAKFQVIYKQAIYLNFQDTSKIVLQISIGNMQVQYMQIDTPPFLLPSSLDSDDQSDLNDLSRKLAWLLVLSEEPMVKIPDLHESHFIRGKAQLIQGQFGAAIDEFNLALVDLPLKASVWENLGEALYRSERFDEALRAIERARALGAVGSRLNTQLARVLVALHKTEEALKALSSLPSDLDHIIDAMRLQGTLLLATRHPEEALLSFEQVLILRPHDSSVLVSKADALNALGRFHEAIALYDRILSASAKVVDDNVRAYAWLGKGAALFDLHSYSEALKSYQHTLELDPENGHAHIGFGDVLFTLHQWEQALASYNRVLDMMPHNAHAFLNKGRVLFEIGQYDASLDAYDQSIVIDPNDDYKWMCKAEVLLTLKRLPESLAAYERAVSLNPHNPDAWNGKGLVLGLLNSYEDAHDAFQHAIKLNPNVAIFWRNAAAALESLGDYKGASAALRQADHLPTSFQDVPLDIQNLNG